MHVDEVGFLGLVVVVDCRYDGVISVFSEVDANIDEAIRQLRVEWQILQISIDTSCNQRKGKERIFVLSIFCFHFPGPAPWVRFQLFSYFLKNVLLQGPTGLNRLSPGYMVPAKINVLWCK